MNRVAKELEERIKAEEAKMQEPVPEPEVVAAEPEVNPEPQPQPEPDPAPESEVQEDLAKKYMEEAENWKKRRKDAERGLHESLQEKAELKKQLEALQQEIESLKTSRTSMPDHEVDDLWAGYDDIKKAFHADLERRLPKSDPRIEQALRELEEQKALVKQQEQERRMQEHYARVASIHPDAADFFNPDSEKSKILLGWAINQAPEYQEAAENPGAHSEQFVIRMLNELKRDLGMTKKAEKPALGDIAVQKSSTSKPAAKVDADIFSEQELGSMKDLIAQNRRDPEKLREIMAKLERTEQHLLTRR